ncbi:hypothetical protein D6833_11005 [Candidatus Parcubacteria bacterium]|nr:MAG: hypothetical protein D6833_11005 [Candidatus Parcubacteria bacterium]
MTDKAWKAFERRIAKYLGGKRRGAYTSDGRTGKSDVILSGWSVECKLLSRPTYGKMVAAAKQAERNRENDDDYAIAVVKRKGQYDRDAIVIMRFEEFLRLYNEVSGER